MSFTIFYIEKTPLQPIKTKSSKSRKTDIFPKGLTWFGSKNGRFCNFFQAIQARKLSLTIFQNEKTPFQDIKTKNSKIRKIDIFSKVVFPCFSSKNRPVSNFQFLGNIGQKKLFYDILERKNAFLGCKNKKFKKSKNWNFSKGVQPSFWSKNGQFSRVVNPWSWSKNGPVSKIFFFSQYWPVKCPLRSSR